MQTNSRIPKQDIEDILGLTAMQQGMLFHYLKNPESREYFEQLCLRLKGEIYPGKIQEAWKHVVLSNEMLRTIFRWDKLEKPVQIVLKDYMPPIRMLNLTEAREQEKEKRIAEIRKKDMEEGINLTSEPMRITLIRISDNELEMMISNHHILYDGWSNSIILKEFADACKRLYKGLKAERVNKAKFKEYIIWNQAQDREKHKAYWREYLKGYYQKTGLPGGRAERRDGSKISKYQTEIDGKLTGVIREFCKERKITAANLLNTAWGILLQRYNDIDDVVFGITVSGRTARIKGIENVAGLFINTIPLRIKLNDKETIFELLSRADSEARDREDYESMPLVEIQGESELGNAVELFDTLLVVENYPMGEALKHIEDVFTCEIADIHIETNYDMAIGAAIGERITITAAYNNYKYQKEIIRNVFRHYLNIIREMTTGGNKLVSEIEIMDKAEKDQILFEFNKNDRKYAHEKPVHILFEEQAERTPDETAVVFRNKILTYRELNTRANQLAWLLKRKGVKADEPVGVMQERSLEMIVSILAILKAGGAYLPLDPGYPRNRIKSMLDRSDISILITNEGVINSYQYTSLQNLRIREANCSLSCGRLQIKALDKLPIPDRTLVDYEKYQQYIGQAMVKNAVSIQATRGCPYNCAYCHKLWPKSHVVRSAENIFHEVNLYYKEGIRRFVFVDDIFNLDAKNSERFFNLVIENGLKIQIFFPQGLRGDILTEEYIDLMVKAGVVSLALALETASPRLQRLIGKNLNLKRLKKNIEYICEKYPGIILELFTMHGFPTETEEEADITLEFIKAIKWLHFPYIHILKIYPETDMARIAMENGISKEAIEGSGDTAYHEVSDTSPFSYEYTKRYQSEFLNEYFLNRERLLKVLPLQMKVLTESELVQKYNSYLPAGIRSFRDLLDIAGIHESELDCTGFVNEEEFIVANFNKKIEKHFSPKKAGENALRILLLDLSQSFTGEKSAMLYDVAEPPLGCMYLLTHLYAEFGSRICGKIAKSRMDFNSFEELKRLISDFKPDVIGVRSLTYYRDFFHRTVALIRHWGVDAPVIAGGPYASSSCRTVLNDPNIDMIVLGEGEITLNEIVRCIMENGGKLPGNDTLLGIPGIAVSDRREDKDRNEGLRSIIILDHAEALMSKESGENPPVGINGENTIYQIYTSGSTGVPKGAMVKHHSFANLLYWYTGEFNINNKDRMLLIASISFDLAQKNLYATLIKGGQLHLFETDSYDYYKMTEVIYKNDITIINCTPSAFYPLLEINEEDDFRKLASLRYVFLGGEPINMAALNKWMESPHCHCEIVNTYGPTECTDVISSYRIEREKAGSLISVPIGKPVYNAHLYILDKKLRILPAGIEGELYAGGKCVGKGYYKDEALTTERFIKAGHLPDKLIYKTGDTVKWLCDGNIEFVGRADNQVKIRGYRIETGEIESKLLKYKAVKEAAVITRENEDKSKYLCAFIVSDIEIDTANIIEFMKKELPEYMLPSFITRLEKLPLTPSGKVDRKALGELMSKDKPDMEHVPPGDELERQLADVWHKVLGIDNIGIHDSFFELGGHSLKAVQTINMIYKLLNIRISIQIFFECQTIKNLAEYIRNSSKEEHQEIEKLPERDYYELSYSQKRLWIISEKDPLNTAYNITGRILFNEAINAEAIQNSIVKLISRHESMRTCIRVVDGRPVQVIAKEAEFEMKLKDVSLLESDEKQNELAQIYRAMAEHVFDLEKAPLFLAELIKLSGTQYELVLCMHHIISDGWSMSILKREFTDFYNGYRNGKELELQPLEIQYKDYSEWQNRQIEKSRRMELAKKYWLEQLADEAPPLRLSNRYDGMELHDNSGAVYREIIDKATIEKLKVIARKNNTTLFTVLLSALNILLMDMTGNDDILLGTAGSGREHESLERIIGFFINTTVLRNRVYGDEAFCRMLSRVNENTLKALEHQSFPLEKIVDELNIKYPHITVFFNMLNMGETEKLEIGRKEVYDIEEGKALKFDLTFYLAEYLDSMELTCTYKKSLFKLSRVTYMIKKYIELLEKIAQAPEKAVADYLD